MLWSEPLFGQTFGLGCVSHSVTANGFWHPSLKFWVRVKSFQHRSSSALGLVAPKWQPGIWVSASLAFVEWGVLAAISCIPRLRAFVLDTATPTPYTSLSTLYSEVWPVRFHSSIFHFLWLGNQYALVEFSKHFLKTLSEPKNSLVNSLTHFRAVCILICTYLFHFCSWQGPHAVTQSLDRTSSPSRVYHLRSSTSSHPPV